MALPVFWTAAEHVRSWVLTGFPWELLGYSQYRCLPVIQIADVTGVYGISFLVVTVNCAVWALLRGIRRPRRMPRAGLLATAALVALTLGYGHTRLRTLDLDAGAPLTIAMIQPAIPQQLKWDPAYLEQTLAIFRTLTLAAADLQADMVLWPESATPFFFASEEPYRRCVEDIVRATGTHLVLGSPALVQRPDETRYYNSAYLIAPDNRILARYDKLHLVPFGEYVPLGRLLPFAGALVAGVGDFSPGSRVMQLPLPACPLAPLICYEIIFPDLVRRFVKQGARAIVNITNDAWFGRTGAPYQHLSMAAVRAVENRRYIARCANTGISACIAPSGEILSQTKLFTQTVLPAMMHCRTDLTLYTRYGDIFAYLCYALSLALLLAAHRRARSQPHGDHRSPPAHHR
jgi:apolipoprotein N-acyltransferase